MKQLVFVRFMSDPAAVGAVVILLLITLLAIFAPQVSPQSPIDPHYEKLLQPPSRQHLMGTDNLGRDVFTRVAYGGRESLKVGVLAALISLLVGSSLGVTAGYHGGWLDEVIMRIIDIFMAIPGFVLALIVIATIGPGLTNVMIALAVSGSPAYARLARSLVLSTKGSEYVDAAMAVGASKLRIIGIHILPNIFPSLLVYTALRVGTAILTAASLSFLGLGAQPPTPEWGAMLSDARNYIREAWWMSVFPGLAIVITCLCINLLGDSLRDILDPKTVSTRK